MDPIPHMVTLRDSREEMTPYRVHLITHFDAAAGLFLPFLHKGLSISAAFSMPILLGAVLYLLILRVGE